MGAESRHTRRTLLAGGGALGLQACQPAVQTAGTLTSPPTPRLGRDVLVATDGARLPLKIWPATDARGEAAEPWAVFVALHGMNDYSAAFILPGPYWAARGVTTYAYDQRGFGASVGRGLWGGEGLMTEDLRTACTLLRSHHPHALLVIVGESMGGAVAVIACASERPPDADRLVLASPAVWGWREQGGPASALLWTAAHLLPMATVTAPGWIARRIRASDNEAELVRMGLDHRMIFNTRIDVLYGLVQAMQHAADRIGKVRTPVLYQYGAHDEIIPSHAAFAAASRLGPGQRTAFYEDGWHLLLRDLRRDAVLDDIVAFSRDPESRLPSAAPPIPPPSAARWSFLTGART